jgi:hypothetical protein
MSTNEIMTRLREALNYSLSDSEVRDLCFDLGADYENIPGQTKDGKIRELLLHMQRRNRMADLLSRVGNNRRDIDLYPFLQAMKEAPDRIDPFSSDYGLLKMHRKLFDRPAFRISCIQELSLDELGEAIDNTQLALNTGSYYSRKGSSLGDVFPYSEYKREDFVNTFESIVDGLSELKRSISNAEELIQQAIPGYQYRKDLRLVLERLPPDTSESIIRRLFYIMDDIDTRRNRILSLLNSMLIKTDERLLKRIELSTDFIRDNWSSSRYRKYI